jgi:methylenetetrahydrofolate dehydrogenase (NADP+)/methenyltetrahydrofolate cyclohydrolase
MIVDGKEIARGIIADLARERALLPHAPRLAIIVASEDPVTTAYVRTKERSAAQLGVELRKEILSPDVSTERIIALMQELALHADGIVVQLPLPSGVDTARVIAAIPTALDVDVLNPTSGGKIQAPVAGAIEEILTHYSVAARDKNAVVVGQGALVGTPAAALLRRLGAKVTIVTTEQGSLTELKDADIIVSGAGSPGLIKPEMLKKGVVLIDAGTSEYSGKIAGDADPSCADVASLFTPVPGGVGPIAIAMLFKNLFTLAAKS